MTKDFDSMLAEVEDWFDDFISSTSGEGDKSAKQARRKVTAARRGLDSLLRECATAMRANQYVHADGTPCDIPRENTLTADNRQACEKPYGRRRA